MSKDPLETAFNENVRERIKRRRAAHQWKQEQVASKVRISIDRYKEIETRDAIPRYLIASFASALGVSIAYLLTGHDEK
jgi:transcriptional regulator with XRE-family HTH domain